MKKIMGILLAVMMMVSMQAAFISAGAAEADVPTLIWWNVGDEPTNIDAWEAAVNEYLEAEIGIRVDYRCISWGEWPTRQNTIINSGEYYDILFTDLGIYNGYVSMNAFADLTPLLESTPGLRDFIPAEIWKGTTTADGIFGVPTYKDTARADFYVIDAQYTDKYDFDPASLNTLEALDPFFRAVKAGEGDNFYPYQMTQATVYGAAFIEYDGLGASLPPLGVSMKGDTRTVVSTLEQDDVMATLKQLHTWFADGIINPDANVATQQNLARPFFVGIGWPEAVGIWQVQEGVEKYSATLAAGPTYTTDSIQGSINSISANSNYKEEALKLLEFVNLDHKARDMFAYGIEGENFEYVSDNVVKQLDEVFSNMSRYSQATFFTMSTVDGSDPEQWNSVKRQNESAAASPLLGFIMNQDAVQNELTACRQVWESYRYDLLTGAADPETMVPTVIAELETAGLSAIIAEAQAQVDAFFAE